MAFIQCMTLMVITFFIQVVYILFSRVTTCMKDEQCYIKKKIRQ